MIFRLLAAAALPALLVPAQVTLTEGTVTIPTYVAGPPDKNPIFYTGRVYQGAKGMVYPYPMQDALTDEKRDVSYRQVCLENEYLKVCVLPELGGRIFEAVDKTNGYNFFYKQSVIKPALIGMLGAWISGGVEWNIPHHHRATSFMPVLYRTHEHKDGSKSVSVGELELRDRMRWAVTLTLRPGSSLLEARVTALNTTPVQNSLLCFANVAVHTNENYQVIFPPSTKFATQHAKREFARWPVADTVYGGVDFTRGVDVSWWKNHPSPISMFAWNDTDDWLAGYDHGRQAGTLHVADRHQVPGKKFFTWGVGPSGKLWDKILSDTDGPYLELMVGAWSDNQPDYSWLQPYEVKTVTQYWYPFHSIGGVKNATRDAALNLDVQNGKAQVGFFVTRPFRKARAVLERNGHAVWERSSDLDPAKPLRETITLAAGAKPHEWRAVLYDAGGRELVSWQPEPDSTGKPPVPPAVVPPREPKAAPGTEELYLTGLRLEQFHNPALEPDPYYEEALRRDPDDVRNNTALAILYLKRGRFADAERLLRRAVARLTANYTRPRDGDALYYLGLALQYQGRLQEAEDWLQRAAWNHAWKAASHYRIAQIRASAGDVQGALAACDRALETNASHTPALFLKAVLLERQGRGGEAGQLRQRIRDIDPIDPRASRDGAELGRIFKEQPAEGLEMALECLGAGLHLEANWILDRMPQSNVQARYLRGWLMERLGQTETAAAHYRLASSQPHDYVFPFQIEMIHVLRSAMEADPKDPRAPYYLGLLLYDRQPEEAVKLWQKTVELDPRFAIAYRNLAVAYSRQPDGVQRAIEALERAVWLLKSEDALYLFELDQLYEFSRAPLEKRLALFDARRAAAEKRDDAMSRLVTLLTLAGRHEEAIGIMEKRHFHLWEGGARFNVQDAWTDAHLLRGHQRMAAEDFQGAWNDYLAAVEFPENLEVTRGYRGSRLPEAYYFAGLAAEAAGRKADAERVWKQSAGALLGTDEEPHPGVDTGASLMYYQARSLEKLGQSARARQLYEALLAAAEKALQGRRESEFFAKFGEGRPAWMRQANAHLAAGLAHFGLGRRDAARAELQKALELNPYLLEARLRLKELR